jgi:hypothetical protein
VLSLLLGLVLALPAAAQPALFVPADDARASLSPRQAELLGHLERVPATAATRLAEARLAVLDEAVVRFNLLPGVDAAIAFERVERRPAGDATYYFRSADDDGTFAILVVREGQITGSVRVANRLYAVRPLTDGLHAVAAMDESRFVEHPPGWDAVEVEGARRWAERGPLATGPATSAPEGTIIQRILVPYSSTAASQVGDILALVQLAVDETNQGYANSNIGHRFELAYTYQTPQAQSTNFSTNLTWLQDPDDGRFDEVHDYREQYGADLVQMILGQDGGLCGQAWTILASGPEEAFAVCSQSCATGYYTFGHEFGHLQGARHNPEADGSQSPFPYGHGKYYDPGNWRTVMSYDCPGGCTRVLHWSNPDILYNGTSTGDASQRDNARVLDETAATVAAFLPDPTVGTAAVAITRLSGSTVPGTGGPMQFRLDFSNTSGATFIGEYWVDAVLPSGNPYGGNPVVGPTALTLNNGQTSSATLTVNVPRRAPAGLYTVTGYVGHYPSDPDDSDSFTFTKLPARLAAGEAEDALAPWAVAEAATEPAAAHAGAEQPAASARLVVYPNPFAGNAAVRFALAEAGTARVAVLDVLGREVAVLADGARAAGAHEATLDARGLPGGVYLVRLQTEAGVVVQRVTLQR